MGCGVSRLDGYGMMLPSKFHTMKTFHYARPLKKDLLFQDNVDYEKCSPLVKNVSMPASSPIEKVNHEEREEKGMERVNKSNGDEAETDSGDGTDDDDDEDDERMIGHVRDDEAFRGSPSFRVYFKDDGEDDHKHNGHENDASISSDVAKSSKAECCEDKKVMKKRGKKKKSSKNYKGVKNLLNYKSRYNTTPSSGHGHANLIPAGKTSA